MSLESGQVKVEADEDWACRDIIMGEPELGPELLQASAVAWPLAGTTAAMYKEDLSVEGPSGECSRNETETSAPPDLHWDRVQIEMEIEPGSVKKVKKEMETEEKADEEWWCGVSEAAERAGLYAEHAVKRELVLGPELLQAPGNAFALKGVSVSENAIEEIFTNGNLSEIEDLDDDFEQFPDFLDSLAVDDPLSEEESPNDDINSEASSLPQSQTPVPPRKGVPLPRKNTHSRSISQKRKWEQIPFVGKPHNYTRLPTTPVRTPIEYFQEYFDNVFMEEVARCTNLYYQRKTGKELKTTASEIRKVLSIHLIMGCIPYPRLNMYWRAETKLALVSDVMARDTFLTIRNALHVVDTVLPPEREKNNPLWKVQPVINKVKQACNKLERAPGFYSVDEQTIPLTGGRRGLRQVAKNKTRPLGLKNFILTTSEGLLLDFEIYQGAKTMFRDSDLGFGPSVVLHLVKSIPPGSCVYHDRFFTTVPLIEKMEKMNLHCTGTIMQNRIPDRTAMDLKTDVHMSRGETQQYVCEPTAIVKWKDRKSVLMASNCTASDESINIRRWDKKTKAYINITAPKVIERYNNHMAGVDTLDQQIEHYRTFIKTKKWTLKVIIHFLDLAVVNSWRLYHNDCLANGYSRKNSMPLLDFRMNLASTLCSIPSEMTYGEVQDASNDLPASLHHYKIYRPANQPPEAKRYDGYDHLPVSDTLRSPRSCRMEHCTSRSKIRCEKCNVYLCLSKDKNCFRDYHKINKD